MDEDKSMMDELLWTKCCNLCTEIIPTLTFGLKLWEVKKQIADSSGWN